jgi:predicted house-cleaning noncanonical NTP pyrophosphatase (MazG superfamily)
MKEKLVRDKIKALSEEAKDGRVFRVADNSEMAELLFAKLDEEVQELKTACLFEPHNIKEEMADVLEVMLALGNVMIGFGFGMTALQEELFRKRAAKGRFGDRIVLDLSTNIPREECTQSTKS